MTGHVKIHSATQHAVAVGSHEARLLSSQQAAAQSGGRGGRQGRRDGGRRNEGMLRKESAVQRRRQGDRARGIPVHAEGRRSVALQQTWRNNVGGTISRLLAIPSCDINDAEVNDPLFHRTRRVDSRGGR
jgi:hypothetical protein